VEDVVAAVSDALADAAAAQGDFKVALAMARRAVEAYQNTAPDAASDADGRSAMRRRQAAACELSAAHAAMQLRQDESAAQHFVKAAQKFEVLKDFKAAASALLRAAELQAGPKSDETYQDAVSVFARAAPGAARFESFYAGADSGGVRDGFARRLRRAALRRAARARAPRREAASGSGRRGRNARAAMQESGDPRRRERHPSGTRGSCARGKAVLRRSPACSPPQCP
jgi:tetratricopeptide (TPR) repeat protein